MYIFTMEFAQLFNGLKDYFILKKINYTRDLVPDLTGYEIIGYMKGTWYWEQGTFNTRLTP